MGDGLERNLLHFGDVHEGELLVNPLVSASHLEGETSTGHELGFRETLITIHPHSCSSLRKTT